MRVLLIDDEQLLVQALAGLLKNRAGCRVGVATSVAVARRLYDQTRPDVVVLNPRLSGASELLQEYRGRMQSCSFIALLDSGETPPVALPTIRKSDSLDTFLRVVGLESSERFPAEGGSPLVLVVDDDPKVREMVTSCLNDEGYGCVAVENGLQALEQLNLRDFGLVLLDIIMPEIGGIDTLVEMKRRKECPPVVILTGLSDQEVARAAMKRGAFDFILKPVEVSRLGSVVEAAIASREYRRPRWSRWLPARSGTEL